MYLEVYMNSTSPQLFSHTYVKIPKFSGREKVKQNSNKSIIWSTVILVLSLRVLSFSRRLRVTDKACFISTLPNKLLTLPYCQGLSVITPQNFDINIVVTSCQSFIVIFLKREVEPLKVLEFYQYM